MRIEMIIVIILLGLNVSLVLSQDSSKVKDTEIILLKDRVTTLENDFAIINVSKGYFVAVISVTTLILSIIVGAGLWYNIYTSRLKLKDMVADELKIQKEQFEGMENQSIKIIEKKLSKTQKDLTLQFTRLEADSYRALAEAYSKPFVKAMWSIRSAKKYDIYNSVSTARVLLGKCRTNLSKLKIGQHFPTDDTYTEFVEIISKLDKNKYSREIELINKEIDRIYTNEKNNPLAE